MFPPKSHMSFQHTYSKHHFSLFMDMEQASYLFLATLFGVNNNNAERLNDHFNLTQLRAWVVFFASFLGLDLYLPYKSRLQRILDTRTKVLCFVEAVNIIIRHIRDFHNGLVDYTFIRGITTFSLFNYGMNACSYITNNVNNVYRDCWLTNGNINNDGYLELKFTDVEVRIDTQQQGRRILAVPNSPFNESPIYWFTDGCAH